MKKKSLAILLIMLGFLFSGCEDKEMSYPSLAIKYYQGQALWSGIQLGETTYEVSLDILTNLKERDSNYLFEGIRFEPYRTICINFQEGYREHGVCVNFLYGKAQTIEFFGDGLRLKEIEESIGEIEYIAVYMEQRQTVRIIFRGISKSAGFYIRGFYGKRHVPLEIQEVKIKDDEEFWLIFVNPNIMEDYFSIGYADEDFQTFLFEDGGLSEWHGPGVYEVQRPDFLQWPDID